MEILVINGSPKGPYSITLHTCLYLEKKWRTSMSMYLVGGLMRNKKLKAKMGNKMNEGMIAPYKKMIDKA